METLRENDTDGPAPESGILVIFVVVVIAVLDAVVVCFSLRAVGDVDGDADAADIIGRRENADSLFGVSWTAVPSSLWAVVVVAVGDTGEAMMLAGMAGDGFVAAAAAVSSMIIAAIAAAAIGGTATASADHDAAAGECHHALEGSGSQQQRRLGHEDAVAWLAHDAVVL
eukprot:CAMPEP_0119556424 /NCGR_PEP_ID=MMETSP1352-20130426/8390_1 /TAXON_ID=265584 /ORGANISM="Stauroneis constricta, Strain CCMP1120" /LENGTH=169 /DNA_ID=CAMNT_0007603387 /DNA_START=250 /DNA_END=755 /DNA_ORIENTATION=-